MMRRTRDTDLAYVFSNGRALITNRTKSTRGPREIVATGINFETDDFIHDPEHRETAPVTSSLTYLNGGKDILEYCGYDIATLAQNCSFIEAAMLLDKKELPTRDERNAFGDILTKNARLGESLMVSFQSHPRDGNPMVMLSALLNMAEELEPKLFEDNNDEAFSTNFARIMSIMRTIAANIYNRSIDADVSRQKSRVCR